MGSVESEYQIEIVPPAGCSNFINCPPAQEAVSVQRQKLEDSDTPIKDPTIIVYCGPSHYNNDQREITAFSAHRFVYNGEHKMTVPQTVIINGSDSCSRK